MSTTLTLDPSAAGADASYVRRWVTLLVQVAVALLTNALLFVNLTSWIVWEPLGLGAPLAFWGGYCIATLGGIAAGSAIGPLVEWVTEKPAESSGQAVLDALNPSRATPDSFGLQVRDGAVLVLVFFVPLDFVLYWVPGTLDFTVATVGGSVTGGYITAPLALFVGAPSSPTPWWHSG
jgi:hypothetical protein